MADSDDDDDWLSIYAYDSGSSEEGETAEVEGVVSRSVTNRLYNYVPFNGGLRRPFCLATALLVRGPRGGDIIVDTSREQAYRPVEGRPSGEDYVCATCDLLWSLGDREDWLAFERKETRHMPCPGYPHLRRHAGDHIFTKYDLLRMYLRHRLRVRILLAGSTVIMFIISYFFI